MSIVVRRARPADRETCIRLLTAQLVEHDLPADPAGIGDGVDLAFAPHSPAWLLLAAAFALYRGRAFRDVHRQRMTWDLS
jgi:hypothetical protein